MRIVYYGSDGAVVEGADDDLIDEFTFTIAGNGSTSECSDKTVVYDDATNDKATAFDPSTTDMFELRVEATLNTRADNHENCAAIYKLYIKDNDEEWTSWDTLIESVKHQISDSRISIDKENADVKINISNGDIEALQTVIPTNDEGTMNLDF